MTAAATVADALECLVCIASNASLGPESGGSGAAAVLQLCGLEAATKALGAAVGNATTGLGLSSSSSRKSLDVSGGIGAAAAAATAGGAGGGSGGGPLSDAGGVLAEREQRRVAMLAVRLVAILLQSGGSSRIQVLSGERLGLINLSASTPLLHL